MQGFMHKKSMRIGFKPQLDVGIGWEGELFRDWEMSCLLGDWLILQTLHLLHVTVDE